MFWLMEWIITVLHMSQRSSEDIMRIQGHMVLILFVNNLFLKWGKRIKVTIIEKKKKKRKVISYISTFPPCFFCLSVVARGLYCQAKALWFEAFLYVCVHILVCMHIYIHLLFIHMNLKVYLTFPFWQAFGYHVVMFRDSSATQKELIGSYCDWYGWASAWYVFLFLY